MNKYYLVTKIVNNDNNTVFFLPTEKLYSMNEVLEYSQYFFNNGKIYQTSECDSNESYIKCVGEDFRMIHLMEKTMIST